MSTEKKNDDDDDGDDDDGDDDDDDATTTSFQPDSHDHFDVISITVIITYST